MTTFVDNSTVIQAVWLNSVDRAVTQAIGTGINAPTTPTEVKVNLGLDQVTNTTDLNKPISTATQTALGLKSDVVTTVVKDSATGAAHMPAGTTAQRPSPAIGDMRYNSDLVGFEGYGANGWGSIGSGQMYGTAPAKAIFFNANQINENIDIETDTNGGTFGPVTIGDGFTVTIASGSVWSIV